MRRAKRVEWCLQMLLGLLLCWALPARCVGQTAPAAREQVEKVRTSVARLAPGAKISVIPIRGAEEFGLLRSSDAGGFTFFDVDEKTEKTMRYEEIKRVKPGFAGYNRARGRHVDRTRETVVVLVVSGALIALIAGAAAAR